MYIPSAPTTTSFPMNSRKSVTLSRTNTRTTLRMISHKASRADVQKFFPYIATCNYTLLKNAQEHYLVLFYYYGKNTK